MIAKSELLFLYTADERAFTSGDFLRQLKVIGYFCSLLQVCLEALPNLLPPVLCEHDLQNLKLLLFSSHLYFHIGRKALYIFPN